VEQPYQTWQYTEIPFTCKQICVERKFIRDFSSQRAWFFQTDHLWLELFLIQAADQVHEQRFSAAHRHAGGDEQTTQGARDLARLDFAPRAASR
jgi:hypothetical protein